MLIICRLRAEKSIIVFTHSKAMMRAADSVLVLQGGRIVESGSYERLETELDGYLKK